MGDMLSQAEIDALLKNAALDDIKNSSSENPAEVLSTVEIDALGEVGNISMGTCATTLSTLLSQKVLITTPRVSITTWDQLAEEYTIPFVAVKVEYTNGLEGSNLLIIKEDDVKVITDLMMGGDGTNIPQELNELHLSAISEAMNQMIGSSATSMSSMFGKRIDISPPKAFVIHFDSPNKQIEESGEVVVKVAFRMVVGELIDSEIMQLLPLSFGKDLVNNLLGIDEGSGEERQPATEEPTGVELPDTGASYQQSQHYVQPPPPQSNMYNQGGQHMDQNVSHQNIYGYDSGHMPGGMTEYVFDDIGDSRRPVNVQPAHFETFDDTTVQTEKENISLIMDVLLEVTVELGRTKKLIREILEFGAGSIIELDKLAGEPVDILVNGKVIAKGEVVVIDENFGVRITDIIQPSKRL